MFSFVNRSLHHFIGFKNYGVESWTLPRTVNAYKHDSNYRDYYSASFTIPKGVNKSTTVMSWPDGCFSFEREAKIAKRASKNRDVRRSIFSAYPGREGRTKFKIGNYHDIERKIIIHRLNIHLASRLNFVCQILIVVWPPKQTEHYPYTYRFVYK